MRTIALRSAPCLAAAALALALTQGAAAQDLAAGSVWKNENNSTMTINSVDPNTGLIAGTFETGVGCGVGTPRPLSGFYNQGAITLTVNFEDCNSATAWTRSSCALIG